MFRATSGGNFPSSNAANHGLKPNHFFETQESFNLHEHLDDILHGDSNEGESEVSFSVQKYSKKEILDIYKSTQNSEAPQVLSLFPIITSEESLTPMAFLPLDPREEVNTQEYFANCN